MNDPGVDWLERLELLAREIFQRGLFPLSVIAGGCCLGGMVGAIGSVVGAIGGVAAAATWLKRRGDATRTRLGSGEIDA